MGDRTADRFRRSSPRRTSGRGLRGALRNRWKHWRDPYRCQEAVELVTEYLEGAMSAAEVDRFERHLRVCPPCVRYLEQVRRTSDVLGYVHPAAPDGTTREALLDAFRDFRRE